MVSDISHHPLSNADGSATFSSPLFSILAGVNGPVDVTRRDELPEEAAIEVNIRPASGIGGPRERWMENVLAATLRDIVLVHLHPRTLIQVTLQVLNDPPRNLPVAVQDVAILPVLLNAAFLALVDGRIPLESSASASLFAVQHDGTIVKDPTAKVLLASKSVHAVAFDLHGGLLLSESSGQFMVPDWEAVTQLGQKVCVAAMTAGGEGDEQMVNGAAEDEPWLRQELDDQAQRTQHWRKAA